MYNRPPVEVEIPSGATIPDDRPRMRGWKFWGCSPGGHFLKGERMKKLMLCGILLAMGCGDDGGFGNTEATPEATPPSNTPGGGSGGTQNYMGTCGDYDMRGFYSAKVTLTETNSAGEEGSDQMDIPLTVYGTGCAQSVLGVPMLSLNKDKLIIDSVFYEDFTQGAWDEYLKATITGECQIPSCTFYTRFEVIRDGESQSWIERVWGVTNIISIGGPL